jgi:threonine synthase
MSTLHCIGCGATHASAAPHGACPACGGLLELELPRPERDGAALRQLFDDRPTERSGVWRYRELVMPDPGNDIVTYPEGNTPLIDRPAVTQWAGTSWLRLKHEGLNPTGSFKDRGMAVAVTHARQIGATGILSASTGNTSSSMAAYAAIAGMTAIVLLPAEQVSEAKVAQTMAYGARALRVRGTFDDCLRLAREASERLGLYLVNSINPYRVSGQKTIVFELLQQLGWDAPDWIALPAGNLGNASAFGAALRDAVALGLIERSPRVLLVQAEGAAPFARSFEGGFTHRVTVAPETVATAIRIGDPASFDRAVRVIRESKGVVTSVTDAEILVAKRVIDRAGVGCEPASAASVAGVRKLVGTGVIAPDARVVSVLTGHLLKDICPAGAAPADAVGDMTIDPVVAEVEAALR